MSTLNKFWRPTEACQRAASFFGLAYDPGDWCAPSPCPNPERGERRYYAPLELIRTIEVGSEFSGEIDAH